MPILSGIKNPLDYPPLGGFRRIWYYLTVKDPAVSEGFGII